MKQLQVGLIGCGGFQMGLHVPNLQKNPKYNIRAAMDINEEAAKKAAEELGLAFWTTSLDELLADKEIDVVFISTRHDSHAELTVKAANAGKHILCEKPMAMNREECRAISEAVKKNKVKYTVGYNRGMAPLVEKAKQLIATDPGKVLMYHRIQAAFPADSWTHIATVGGGRFVGEGCHIFDLLCELAPAPPVSVYAAGGTFLDPNIVKICDSGIITITYADGSVGTTIIASDGCPTFPKEATEIYVKGKAIFIDNFLEMTYCGYEGQDKVKIETSNMDKGHMIEIDQLADAIVNDTDPPNGIVNAARAAVISFMVSESIASGKAIPISEADYVF